MALTLRIDRGLGALLWRRLGGSTGGIWAKRRRQRADRPPNRHSCTGSTEGVELILMLGCSVSEGIGVDLKGIQPAARATAGPRGRALGAVTGAIDASFAKCQHVGWP